MASSNDIHIVTICGCGMGSSLMLRINIEKLLKELSLKGTVEVADMIAGKGMSGDIMVTTSDILKALGDTGKQFKRIVVLSNLVSKKELRSKLEPILAELTEARP
jgi:PTS system ascorbate-specific IIB component